MMRALLGAPSAWTPPFVLALLLCQAVGGTSQTLPVLEGGGVEPPWAADASLLAGEGPLAERLRVVYWPGGEGRAERVVTAIMAGGGLPGLPDSVPSEATFYLAPDQATWDELTSGAVPEWGAGVAFPDRNMAVVPLFASPSGGLAARDRTVLHEWAHLGLHEYLRGLRIPRWFDEGYAQRAAGGWNTAEAWRLRVALAAGGAPPLDSLTLDWPRGTAEAELAYLLAGSAVEYLVSESGDRGLGIFLERWRSIGSFEAAFRQTFGLTTGTFETRWIRHVESRYGLILVLTQTAAFWALAGMALLVLWRWRRARDRDRLARLRATQPSDAPAFWVEGEGRESVPGARLSDHDTSREESEGAPPPPPD